MAIPDRLSKGFDKDAKRSRTRERALRSGAAPLQAHHREDGPLDRAARPRVLRKTDRRAQAQARCRRQAPLQAPAQPAVAAQALLKQSAQSQSMPGANRFAPFAF